MRSWTLSGWHAGSPGTGGVYVEGLTLEAGESVEVIPEADYRALYDAAMWVVLTWDTQGSQHHSMPALRRALGFPPPGARPTREEAQERLKAWMAELLLRGGD